MGPIVMRCVRGSSKSGEIRWPLHEENPHDCARGQTVWSDRRRPGRSTPSATTEVLPDPVVAKGTVIFEDGIVRLNPSDIGNADAISRFFARNGKKFDLEFRRLGRAELVSEMEKLLKTVPQNIQDMAPAIGLKPLEAGAPRGLTTAQLPPQARFVGWGGKQLTAGEMDLLRSEALVIVDIYLSKGSDGYIVFHASGKPPEWFSVPLAADAQLKLEGLVIESAALKAESVGNVVIGASSSLSRGELEGMKAGAAARSGGAGNGGGGGKGGGGFFEFFGAGDGGPRKQFWFTSGRRERCSAILTFRYLPRICPGPVSFSLG